MPGKVLRQDTGEADVDIGIILALKEEFTELLQEIGENYQVRHEQASNYYYYLFVYPGRSWRCAATFIGDMGPVQAGLATQQFINDIKPRILVLLGIAGALGSQLRLGDVVIADQVDAYLENSQAAGKQESNAYQMRFSGQVYRGSADLVSFARHFEFAHPQLYRGWQGQCRKDLADLFPREQLQRLKRRKLVREAVALFEGHLASGPVVAASRAYIEQLRARDRHYLAVDMEAAGLLTAVSAQARPVHTLIMRAISDYADERKATLDTIQEGALRRYATRNVVRLLWQFLAADLPLAVRTDAPVQLVAQRGESRDTGAVSPIRLVYLYDARDQAFRQQIALALAPFCGPGGLLVEQSDYQLQSETSTDAAQAPPLPAADIVVVLLSPDLPLPGDRQRAQVTEILARHRARTTRVVPVLVRALDLGRTPFADLFVLPANRQALSDWVSRPQALLDVAQGIYRIMRELGTSSV